MKTKLLLLAAASTLIMSSSAVHAEDAEGWYIGVSGGGNNLTDDRVTGTGFNQDTEYEWGYAAQGSVGYHYNTGLRSELEVGYRSNKVDTIATSQANGDINVYSAMVNVLYDFDISDTGLDTYVGAGAGVAHIDFDQVSPAGGTVIDDSDTTTALQAIAGVSYDIGDSTEAYANYQYFHAHNPDFINDASVPTKSDYDSSTIMLGLKFNLFDSKKTMRNKPIEIVDSNSNAKKSSLGAMGKNVAQGNPVSRTYIIFFDLNKDNITKDAMAILAQAAQDATTGNAVYIQVVGHADTSGTKKHNMQLSNKRAENVEMALSNMGLELNNIRTVAKGESDPLISTGNGVREPQNRRVEITYVINQ